MGKVKLLQLRTDCNKYGMYQFPMGKVKVDGWKATSLSDLRYQFPMGKVKNKILCLDFIIHTIYGFVNKKLQECVKKF